jgi:putative restriction endonuclease
MAGERWTEAEVKRALYLYFQLPFGQLDQRNSEIIALAGELGRTPSSVAMKLANFASLDPKIVESGRKGLSGASALDRTIWDLFHQDWTKLILENELPHGFRDQERPDDTTLREDRSVFKYQLPEGGTSRRAEVEQRIGQGFFRRAVLANFSNCCCITGISAPKLLIASHISPWGTDIENRHNPRNGLCFSATFDRAFDAYLMTVTPDLRVRLSPKLLDSKNIETCKYFERYEGVLLRNPTHISPDPAFLTMHNSKVIL